MLGLNYGSLFHILLGKNHMSDDNQFIRAKGRIILLNDHQINEVLKCADPDNGCDYFLRNYFYIQHPVKGQTLYDPYDYQVNLIKNYHENRFSVSLLGRQLGKTTSAAGYLLWFAMFNTDKTILVAAHQYSGAQEIMHRIRYAYEMCPMWLKPGIEAYNQGNIDFENKSRIVARATTEKTGRGMSLSLLYCLDGDTSYVKVRNKKTLLEEEITLKELYTRLYKPEKVFE